MAGWWDRLGRLTRHRWADEATVRRALPADALERLGQRVTASEQRHSGQIRICIEAGLPWSYIRRDAPARERAITLFGKLRVWDTAHNNGVLIYVLLAEHAIEIVADRGLATPVGDARWQATDTRMREAFEADRFEDGITLALEEVSGLLVTHFPTTPGQPPAAEGLPDAPVVL